MNQGSFHRQTLLRLRGALSEFLGSAVGPRAKLLMTALLILMFAITGMNVVNSFVCRDFMSAIEQQDMGGFSYYAWIYFGVFVLSTITGVLFRFTEEHLGLLWRRWMTRRVIGLYIDRGIYAQASGPASISNPDQRIAEDVRNLTVTTLSFALMLLNSTITAISFAGVLWAISPALFAVSVGYAILGSAFTIVLGRPLVRLNYTQSDFEANFRSELIRIRENAQRIADAGEEQKVKGELLEHLDMLIDNMRHIITTHRNLGFFTSGYNYLIQLIPIVIVAPLFIHGKVEFGIIGQSAMAFATMVGAFSFIVTQFPSLSSYAAVVTRLSEFVEASENAGRKAAASG